MTTSILTTKLYIPPTPTNLISRPRLVEKLNQGFSRKLTLISAPAGFGKTTLVSECVSHCGHPVAWYSLEEGDDDLVRFLAHLIAALQTINPDIGVGISNILGSSQPTSIEPLLTDLINQIAQASFQSVLVFDDYHVIESSEIDQAILYLLSHLPPQMHLVIATRTDPTFPLSRLRSRGQLTEIRMDDLRFSAEEAALFLRKGMGLEVSAEDIASLESRTDGWIAGLQLAAISMKKLKSQNEITRFVKKFSSSHRFIMDYLTDEVLQQRPEGTRDFLLQTSILNRLSAPLCKAVTEMENSQEILEILDTANLFLIPLDNERYWYRYHHLFDDLLQKRLSLLQPVFVSELHFRAAEWYKQNGWISEALYHLLAAEDYTGAADLVEQNAKNLLARSELATCKAWIDALPEAQVKCRPWLCVYHAWALRLSGAPFDAVQARIEDAEAAIRNQVVLRKDHTHIDESVWLEGQGEKLNGHILGLKAFQQLFKENIADVLRLTQQAQDYKLEENFVLAAISFARGWALRFSGDLGAAYQAFAETVQYSLDSGNIYMAVAGSSRAAYGRVLGGELQRAYENFLQAVAIATDEDGAQYPVVGYPYVYLGGIHYEWNNLEDAKRYLLEGIELCSQVGYIMDQVVGLVTLALVHKASGEWEAAQDAIQKADNLRHKMKSYLYVRRWVENVQIRFWRAQEAWHEIIRWIQTCGLSTNDNLELNRDMEHIILARALVYLGCNQPNSDFVRDALSLLDKLLAKAESVDWHGKEIEILVLQALAYQALGDEQSAFIHLEKAIKWAEPEGYVRTFVDEGEPMAALLRQAASQGIGLDYVKGLLSAFGEAKKDDRRWTQSAARKTEPSLLTEPLSARELEVLDLLAIGKTNQEIAAELIIAVTTAKKHVSNIIGKLGVTNRTESVSRARELGII